MPATPSSASPSPSSSSAPSNAPSHAIPVAIAAIAVLFLVSLMLLALHFRRQNKKKTSAAQTRKGREVHAGETVSRTHPAALMITPAEGKGTPRFVHTPGTNMRIATRRADGAWEFADPRAPFTPAIIADAADAPPSVRNSAAAATLEPPPSRASNSPYSHASYEPGSTAVLLPPPTAASAAAASPWGAQTPTPRTTDSPWGAQTPTPHTADLPWGHSLSRSPSASGSGSASASFLPPSSRRSSIGSSNGSFLDLDGAEPAPGTNPFLSPPPSRAGRNPTVTSPLRAESVSPEPASPAPRMTPEPVSPAPAPTPMTPAARAKETESRAAREIRRGYERVDQNRDSEYADQGALPAY